MEVNAEKLLLGAIQEGIANAVKVKLEGYNSPPGRHDQGVHSRARIEYPVHDQRRNFSLCLRS